METNLKYINQICVDLGGVGGHVLNVAGENEICTLLGGEGGHSLEIDALNEICTIQGVTAGHSLNLNALNAISEGSFVTNLDAWAAIQQGGGLNGLNLISTTIENTAKNKVVITFSKENTDLLATDFSIDGFTISLLERDITNKILTLTIDRDVKYTDNLIVDITYNGNTVSQYVTNNIVSVLLGKELLYDQYFNNAQYGWQGGGDWSFSTPNYNYDGLAVSDLAQLQNRMIEGLTISTKYRLKFTISNATTYADIWWLNANGSNPYIARTTYANGTHVIDFTTPASNVAGISAYAYNSGSSFSISGISLKEIIDTAICIGDSITYGTAEGESYPGYIDVLRNMTTVENTGVGGYSASDWWENKFSLYDYTDYKLATILLGQNEGLTDTLAEDTASGNYLTYADTNTGNYCKIIEGMMAANPNIKIVIINRYVGGTWDVVTQIAEKYSLPEFNLYNNSVWDILFDKTYYPSGETVHFNKYGLNAIGNILSNFIESEGI